MSSELIVQMCRNCGKRYYPHKARCSCGSIDFLYEKLGNCRGRILTYTTIYVPPIGFTPPLRVAIADVGGLKLLGRLKSNRDPEIGEEVDVTLEDGIAVFVPMADRIQEDAESTPNS
ncbi:MAG: hypothetical protein QXU52_05380 [Fervidicoccaceae archaeon]